MLLRHKWSKIIQILPNSGFEVFTLFGIRFHKNLALILRPKRNFFFIFFLVMFSATMEKQLNILTNRFYRDKHQIVRNITGLKVDRSMTKNIQIRRILIKYLKTIVQLIHWKLSAFFCLLTSSSCFSKTIINWSIFSENIFDDNWLLHFY